jgi:hypothetical protein
VNLVVLGAGVVAHTPTIKYRREEVKTLFFFSSISLFLGFLGFQLTLTVTAAWVSPRRTPEKRCQGVLFIFMDTSKAPNLSPDILDYLSDYYKLHGFGMNVMSKSSSKLMKAIGWLFGVTKISPDFMDHYITTIGNTVYVPDHLLRDPDENLLRVLVHEGVHIYDSNKLTGPVFKFLYLFPQSLAVFSLLSFLAFWKIGFLWCLLFLLGLAPLPAPGRYYFELRAYRTSVLFARKCDFWKDEQMVSIYEWIEKQMTTSLYYWTWPFPNMVRKHLKDETWIGSGVYKPIFNWVVMRNVKKKYRNL